MARLRSSLHGCLALLALAAMAPSPIRGQAWQPMGPEGGYIDMLEFFGEVGFAKSHGRLYRTTDAGGTWTYQDRSRLPANAKSIIRLGRFLFAGTWDGVFRSVDAGASWTRLASPSFPNVTAVEALTVHRGVLMFRSRGSGPLLASSDSGETWARLSVSSPKITPQGRQCFAADDSALYLGGDGLAKSLDGGLTWTDLKSALNAAMEGYPYVHVHSMVAGKAGLFVGVPGAVFRSRDGGATWTSMLRLDTTHAFSALAFKGDTLLAGNAVEGLWVIPLDKSAPAHIQGFRPGISVLSVTEAGLFAGTDEGVFRSVDGGGTWVAKNAGIRGWPVPVLASREGWLHAGGGVLGVFRSPDQGASWELVTGESSPPVVEHLAWNGNTLFAHTRYLGKGIYRSDDNGATWVEVDGFLDTLEVQFLTARAGVLYANVLNNSVRPASGLFRSTDNGRSWSPATESIRRGTAYIHSFAFSGSWIHVLTDSGYVRIDAATGKVNGSGIYPEGAQEIFASGGRLFASGGDAVIWYSENQGITWKKGAVAKPWTGYITSFADHGQAVYAGIFGSGVYRSIDGGASWEPFDAEGLDPLVHSLAVSGNRLFAGTESSIYGHDIGGQSQVFGRQSRGRQGIQRRESSHRLGAGTPYLEVLLGGDRSRIIRVDGRRVADVLSGPEDGH